MLARWHHIPQQQREHHALDVRGLNKTGNSLLTRLHFKYIKHAQDVCIFSHYYLCNSCYIFLGGFFVLWQQCSKKAVMFWSSLLVGQMRQFSTAHLLGNGGKFWKFESKSCLVSLPLIFPLITFFKIYSRPLQIANPPVFLAWFCENIFTV